MKRIQFAIITTLVIPTVVTSACGSTQARPESAAQRVAIPACTSTVAYSTALFGRPDPVDGRIDMRGALGCLDASRDPQFEAERFLSDMLATEAPRLELTALTLRNDRMGKTHIRLGQRVDGLEIVGAQLIVHSETETGRVVQVTGRLVNVEGLSTVPQIDAAVAIPNVIVHFLSAVPVGEPELVIVLDTDGAPHLAWAQDVRYQNDVGPQLDRMFISAVDGSLLARHPHYESARVRKIYDALNGTNLPGALALNEGGSSSDIDVQSAYDYIGETYDYYANIHGRDSYDDSGSSLVMSVHFDSDYNNAFWNGEQMVFGDGDGSFFGPFARALDVVAHELSHGVTQETAGLIYQDEPGAINEAMSDIMGASAEHYSRGVIDVDIWNIGEDCYTPGQSGDALRYMDDPTLDGYSYDYYPERYTGSDDNGGVHLNSGIANLAFYLLVSGGSHPRGKTSVQVTGVGFSDAERIVYEALANYLTPTSGFHDTRAAWKNAATDLFGAGSQQVASVTQAWDAVGVGTAQPSFYADTTFGYAPLGVQFTNTSSGGSSYYWTFGDGQTSNLSNPYHTFNYTGNFMTRLSVDGSNPVALNIAVVQAPVVDFGADDTKGDGPHKVHFENRSSGNIFGYMWDFGDGNTSTDVSPTHTYHDKGSYTVRLSAQGEAGPVEAVKADYIQVREGDGEAMYCTVSSARPHAPTASWLALLGMLLGVGALFRTRQRSF